MESFYDEVESLEAILMDDVTIGRNSETNLPEMIETTIFPEIGGDTDRQYICIKLQVIPEPGYPDISPKFNLLKPRGLDEQRLNEIKIACNMKIKESVGFPVVFDLIEVIREHLTDINLPSGQCVICLYGFKDGDDFTKTECFHYLHSFCLARHLAASRRNWEEEIEKLPAWLQKTADPFQATCPVCREKIGNNMDTLKIAAAPSELESAPEFHLTDSLKKLQQKMANLFLIQKSRGAIINIDEEESSVLSIETEDEIQRRLAREQRKHRAKINGDQQSNMQEEVKENGKNEIDEDTGENYKEYRKNSTDLQNFTSDDAKPSGSASNNRITVNHSSFTPIVNNAPTRYQSEPTPNSTQPQHYNRRHYRGGNRRYHHHREFRDRERYSNNTEEPAVIPQESPPSSSGQKTHKNNGNQNKTGNGHFGNSSNKRLTVWQNFLQAQVQINLANRNPQLIHIYCSICHKDFIRRIKKSQQKRTAKINS